MNWKKWAIGAAAGFAVAFIAAMGPALHDGHLDTEEALAAIGAGLGGLLLYLQTPAGKVE